jgi:N-acetylglucosamine kinase-like BadF-type ATPase
MSDSALDKERLVLGLDIGGTWTRALLATTAGRRVGSGRSAGANPAAHGVAVAADRIAAALRDALGAGDPGAVESCVVGLAGASQYASDPATARAFEQIWRAAGLTCPVRVTSDVAVAFAAGTARPAGSVLLAGTGAVAAQIRDREPVTIHGGYGWLLGDDGSGFWIGRQAVRAALSALDGRAPMSPLPRLVHAWYLDGVDGHAAPVPVDGPTAPRPHRRPTADLISEVNRRPAISLADLAPLVMQAYAAGDTTAEMIVREAAELLVATFEQSRTATDDGPIVLGGGLLAAGTPVHDLVVPAILRRWPTVELRTALDGSAAAAWLAALSLKPAATDTDALHARLLPGPSRHPDVAPSDTLL